MSHTSEHPLQPPPLEELVDVLRPALESNYQEASISILECPNLRKAPFNLAAEGLSGRECIADIGGQPNLFPEPRLDRKYSMVTCARQMGMSQDRGMLIGAGVSKAPRKSPILITGQTLMLLLFRIRLVLGFNLIRIRSLRQISAGRGPSTQ